MKRNWPYYLAVLCLAVLFVCAFLYWERIFPSGEVSEVYSHYCEREDLQVEFFKDYRIGDSITVDVTTITAKDSAGWEAFLRELNIEEFFIERQRESLKNGIRIIHLYYCKKGCPEKTVSTKNCPDFNLVAESPRDKTVYIFDINDIEQGRTIICEKISELIQTNLWNNQSK